MVFCGVSHSTVVQAACHFSYLRRLSCISADRRSYIVGNPSLHRWGVQSPRFQMHSSALHLPRFLPLDSGWPKPLQEDFSDSLNSFSWTFCVADCLLTASLLFCFVLFVCFIFFLFRKDDSKMCLWENLNFFSSVSFVATSRLFLLFQLTESV